MPARMQKHIYAEFTKNPRSLLLRASRLKVISGPIRPKYIRFVPVAPLRANSREKVLAAIDFAAHGWKVKKKKEEEEEDKMF